MVIYANTKYNPDDRVMCRFKNQSPGEISEGIVSDIRVIHSKHARMDRHMIYYSVEPVSMVGFEHDDDETFYEKEILGPAPQKEAGQTTEA